jgi:hypothetical protein
MQVVHAKGVEYHPYTDTMYHVTRVGEPFGYWASLP